MRPAITVSAAALLAVALGASAATPSAPRRLAQRDGGANPYLDAHCPRTMPVDGSTCSTTHGCSYGAGMCGPQCDCVHGRWHCGRRCI